MLYIIYALLSYFLNMKKSQKRFTNRAENAMVRAMEVRNVIYQQGVPKSINSIEQTYSIDLVSSRLTNTLTAGSLSVATSLDPTSRIDSWNRWSAVFKQYFVVKIRAVYSIDKLDYSGTPLGQVFFRIEEDNSVPTGSIVRQERGTISLAMFQDEEKNSGNILWTPRSAEDLEWIATASGFAPAYLKTYADPTNTGTVAADSTTRVSVTFYYRIVFRYLA